jgi:regulator of protease activity HflC (stomatin/prohibitin superfamily)
MNILRIRVKAYHVALVYRYGRLVRVLTEGKHWVPLNALIETHNMALPYAVTANINVLLENTAFRALVNVVDVRDNELVIQYRDGIYEKLLTPGRYVYWNTSLYSYTRIACDMSELEVSQTVPRWLITGGYLLKYIQTVSIETYERGLLYVDGMHVKVLDPGVYYYWKNEKSAQVIKADLRKQQLEISGQEILTKDKAAIRINFQAQYAITDVVKAMVSTRDSAKQLYVLLQLALREYAGMLTLDEILSRKDDAQTVIAAAVASGCAAIGMEVLTCGIRDIILPGDVKDIMNQVLIAEKRAQANVITRREETASTRSLLNTAKLLEDNAMLYKLKEMEYVEKIAEKINSISLAGGSQIVEQLREIFLPAK